MGSDMPIAKIQELSEMDLRPLIHEISGVQVMLDRDLAALYGVDVRVLNQAVKRNIVLQWGQTP